jgi:DNA-binding CsgD family transcriptional regulator
MFIRGCPSGVYWLRDIAPDDFYDSEFYRVFDSQIGLSDSVDLLWRINEDTALNIFIERSIRSAKFQAMNMLAVESLLPMILAAAAKHHELTAAASRRETDNLTHRKVQSTMDNFASSLLTHRERQVLFYMISGYSSALTAQRLNTSEGTIKIHRKNIHKKLDIGSQAELLKIRAGPDVGQHVRHLAGDGPGVFGGAGLSLCGPGWPMAAKVRPGLPHDLPGRHHGAAAPTVD